MTDRSQFPASIRARVHDGAIDRVTRFFNSSVADAAVELIQNARRSGATRLDVVTEAVPEAEASGGIRVTVTDDGDGIANPAVLLSFGESGWNATTTRREDPAGIGVYALSKRGCTVSSRPRDSDSEPIPGWRATLTPDCFLGKEDAPVHACDGAPWPHGTAISFMTEQTPEAIKAAVDGAARHCPLPITFNGEPVERRAFLDGAVHVETWRGLAFGVFRNRLTGFHTPDLNFHGLTLAVRLSTVGCIEGGTWSVRADIRSCPELELVLPARKEAVETPFLDEVRDAARLAIYRAMAVADPAPRVAWADRKKASDAGIEMPEPPAELRPWRPGTADIDDWRDAPPFAPVGADALVTVFDPEPQDAQAFHRAAIERNTVIRSAERAGMAGRLFEGDTRFEGYGWYDALARLTNVATDITEGGVTHPLHALRAAADPSSDATTAPGFPDTLTRPDAIHMHLHIVRGKGPSEAITIPADLTFVGEGWTWVAEAHSLVTRESNLTPVQLKQLLRASFFSPSDDAESDSYETQKTRFEDDAMHIAVKLLASEEPRRVSRRTRPDAIHMHLHIVRGKGPSEAITIPADLTFVGEGWTWVAEAHSLVTRESNLTPVQLKQLLRASFFSPSDDAESDSYETQKTRFEDDAMHIAVKLLASEEEAQKHTIAEAVLREIFWVMPRDREVSITVANGRVSVAFAPEPPTPAGAVA